MNHQRNPSSIWVAERVLSFLKTPQRILLEWFGGPKFLSFLAALRGSGLESWGFGAGRQTVGHMPNSPGASLHELRTAKAGEWLWVPLDKIRTFRAQVFSAEQHPFSRYLRDGLKGMQEFFDLDQPGSSSEYLFIGGTFPEVEVDGTPPQTCRVWPWAGAVVALPEPPSFPYWRAGPKTKSHMLDQSRRLDKLLKSINDEGFIINQADLPWYSLLIDDSDPESLRYRVLVQHGNHRLAVLAHLGWDSIPMAPLPTMQSNEVRLSELESWPGVLDGTFTDRQAKIAFMAFFRDFKDTIIPHLD